MPGLRTEGGSEWMGFRPSLPDTLPAIGPARRGRARRSMHSATATSASRRPPRRRDWSPTSSSRARPAHRSRTLSPAAVRLCRTKPRTAEFRLDGAAEHRRIARRQGKRMTTFRTLATVRHHGMELTDYEFTVPLDHDRPSGETLSIFARAVKNSETRRTRPALARLPAGRTRISGAATARQLRLAQAGARRLSRAAARFARQRTQQRRAAADAGSARRRARAGRLSDEFPRRQHRARRRVDPSPAGRRTTSRGAYSARATAGSARFTICRAYPHGLREVFITGGLPPLDGSRRRLLPAHLSRGPAQDAQFLRALSGGLATCARASWSTCTGTMSRCRRRAV